MTQIRFINKPSKSFNSFVDDLFTVMPSLSGELFNSKENIPVNIREEEHGYVLDVFAPGFEKDDFTVSLDKNLLTVSAEKKNNQENHTGRQIRKEFRLDSFKRTFTVDEKILASNIVAKYLNGVLTLNLPKKEEVKEEIKQISIL
jgi:HSP20 family protein